MFMMKFFRFFCFEFLYSPLYNRFFFLILQTLLKFNLINFEFSWTKLDVNFSDLQCEISRNFVSTRIHVYAFLKFILGLLLDQDHDLQSGQDLDQNHQDGDGSLLILKGFMFAIFPTRWNGWRSRTFSKKRVSGINL